MFSHTVSLFHIAPCARQWVCSAPCLAQRAEAEKKWGITFQMFLPYTDPNQQPWLRHKTSDVEHQVSKDPVIVRQEDLQAAIEPVLIDGDEERFAVKRMGKRIGSFKVRRHHNGKLTGAHGE